MIHNLHCLDLNARGSLQDYNTHNQIHTSYNLFEEANGFQVLFPLILNWL
jgi:hypothetical protein